jgi:hypothetical protein
VRAGLPAWPTAGWVEVRQVARALDGSLLAEARVLHVYAFRGDLVARMDVEQPA